MTIEPKYRRPLNTDQLLVLRLLYTFRFGSSELIARRFGKSSGKAVQKRLSILEDQAYIAKHYDKSYKLAGKPASYYLLPKAPRLLQVQHGSYVPNQAIKNRYKDKTASDKFITHCLTIFSACMQLKAIYGDKLDHLTNSSLSLEKYDFFPRWLPDVYLSLKGGAKGTGKLREYFLDIFEETVPFFVIVRRIKSYLTYAQSDQWDSEALPTILMVCETPSIQKRLRRRIAKELSELWDDELTVFYTTTIQELMDITEANDKVWQLTADVEVIEGLGEI